MPGTAKKVARSDQLCRNLERTVLPRVHHTVVDFLFHRCFFLQLAHSMEGLALSVVGRSRPSGAGNMIIIEHSRSDRHGKPLEGMDGEPKFTNLFGTFEQ